MNEFITAERDALHPQHRLCTQLYYTPNSQTLFPDDRTAEEKDTCVLYSGVLESLQKLLSGYSRLREDGA
jgi:hypothetical protein